MIYPTAYAQRIVEHLPYALTDAQKRVWNEVLDDLGSDHSMSRLIQGDVGSIMVDGIPRHLWVPGFQDLL